MNSKENLNIILLLGIVSFSLALDTSCPYKETNSPTGCSCTGTIVICISLSEIPALRTGPNITAVDTLTFLSGTIENVNESNLPPGLVSIEFYDNPLTNISRDAFQASASTLRVLSFSGASFTKLPDVILELTNLTTLSISKTYIQDWDNVTLEYLASRLLSLTLVDVGLSAWPSWFSMFHSLTHAKFSGYFSFIPEDAFHSLNDTLEELALQMINLKEIPQALLVLRNLTSLDLSYNNLTYVNGKPGIEQLALFPFAKSLVRLTILSAGLTVIPNFSFLTNLTIINLSKNEISDLDSGSFPPTVTTLQLDHGKLTSVPTIIANMSRLTFLSLVFNQISEIRSEMFPENITSLILSRNNLTEITDASFANLSSLVMLSLQFNPISSISPSAFKSLQSLKTLVFLGDGLSLIPLALIQLTRLQTLSMVISTLSCPCPAPPVLVQWFESFNGTLRIVGSCGFGITIDSYLKGSCSTQLPTTQPTTSTTTDDAPAFTYSYMCRCASIILPMLVYLCRFS